ncbi:hypothetical protein F503_05603 [Ophiostoma piceae UAMH 11346]|uniref:Lipid droplet-associated hydrolase n=1 Tax=Ophiostoma piceae (strain UAMH 11346) TaxID=1262450 RepID=S3CUW2_OPHP1|nr:hypothetical protein F503_05603 [Ophiostoma piceae UAMH 11346]
MPVWLSYPARSGNLTADTKHCLIYFVPGNPGYIDYYEPFLSTLRTLLDEVEDAGRKDGARDVRFHLLGRNLIGFEDGDDGGGCYGYGPYDLDTQIRAAMDCVLAARIDLGRGGGPRHGEAFDEVVLMGHSVGSFISLDIFRRLQEQSKQTNGTTQFYASASSAHVRLRLGVLLFATLTHLAQSQRGRQLERLMEIPLLGPYAHMIAQALLWCLPLWLKGWVVRNVLGFPPHAAEVTTRFLASKGGARQALFLGRDELVHIGDDQWEDELWEVTHATKNEKSETTEKGATEETAEDLPPKFVILFGQNDHWVANDFRDRFIARRDAHEENRARIVMDERGWPHDFCIRHGEEVAETVKTWIADIAGEF